MIFDFIGDEWLLVAIRIGCARTQTDRKKEGRKERRTGGKKADRRTDGKAEEGKQERKKKGG